MSNTYEELECRIEELEQLIKEANKVAKNEKEMSDLITRNKEIQEDCN